MHFKADLLKFVKGIFPDIVFRGSFVYRTIWQKMGEILAVCRFLDDEKNKFYRK